MEDQVKTLAERYSQIEAQLGRSTHHVPDGGTKVDESRKYFGKVKNQDEMLIRELRKSARFKPGESLDTAHVPNVVVDLAKRPPDQRKDGEEDPYFYRPQRIGHEMQELGQPDVDPFANVKGDEDQFRMTHGTSSPDGRYAIALGFSGEKINWDNFRDKDGSGGEVFDLEDVEGLRNFVVDLSTQKILGETGSEYFYTVKRSLRDWKVYGFRECDVTWSPDSTVFVQLYTQEDHYDDCHAGKIVAGLKLAGVVDLGTEVEKQTFAFIKKRPPSTDLRMEIDQVSNDGDILIKVEGVAQRGNRARSHSFSLSEHMRLRETPDGVHLEKVNVRNTQKD